MCCRRFSLAVALDPILLRCVAVVGVILNSDIDNERTVAKLRSVRSFDAHRFADCFKRAACDVSRLLV